MLELLLRSMQVFTVYHQLVPISKSSVNCIKAKHLKRQHEKDDDELTSQPHKKTWLSSSVKKI